MKKQNSVVVTPSGSSLNDSQLQNYLNDGYTVVSMCAQIVSSGNFHKEGCILVIVEKEILE